jgi:ketosteroid isomerase-like protein
MRSILTLALLLLMESCNNELISKYEKEVKDTDIEFSNFSIEQGANAAFLKFAADDVVLLKPNMLPIVGHLKLEEYFNGKTDTAYTLKWKPSFAKVSKSGDLGYTYGVWELFPKSEPVNIRKGTYLTIWERQANGEWRFVLDTGNQGLGE